MLIFAKSDDEKRPMTTGEKSLLSKSFSSNPAVLEDFYTWLEGALSPLLLGKENLNRVVLSTAEAFSNALLHGNRANPKKKVWVQIVRSGRDLAMRVGDEGVGSRPHAPKKSRPLDTSGRGWEMMHKLADRVSIRRQNGFFWVELSFKMPKDYKEQPKKKGGKKGAGKICSGGGR